MHLGWVGVAGLESQNGEKKRPNNYTVVKVIGLNQKTFLISGWTARKTSRVWHGFPTTAELLGSAT